MTTVDLDSVLGKAREGINGYLEKSRKEGRIDQQLYQAALDHTYPTIEKWLNFPEIPGVSSRFKDGIVEYVKRGEWEQLVNAFRQEVRFGTGGIRGMMAFDKSSIVKLKEEGIDAAILKGTNTINDLVFSLTTAGVAKFGRAQSPKLDRVVVGYDSRVRGFDFAKAVARVFLGYGYTVYFFDAPCPYPEITFAIPDKNVKADIGVLISASHNDYRYNGYKLSCGNGSQFDPKERDEMYNTYIQHATVEDIKICEFEDAPKDKLYFLGGSQPVEGFNYAGREDSIINMHRLHREHIQTFLMTKDLAGLQASSKTGPLMIGFCPFHGAGIEAVPRLLKNVGFDEASVKPINGSHSNMGLNELNGLFPAFRSDPGKEQQPDPGDPRSAETLVKAFKEDYPGQFDKVDILVGTDPDADRCGIVVKIPKDQRESYGGKDYYLLPADDMWTLVMWYRIHMMQDDQGQLKDAAKRFVVLSHTTSDSITLLAKKHGVGVVRTWVGFAALAASTRDVWEGKVDELLKLVDGRDARYVDLCHPFVADTFDMDNGQRSINDGAMEQSNGFSILGGPPPDKRSLGEGGHVRDKDGTFAALLVAEIAAWAKAQGSSIIELLDKHIYLDPDIGLFATFYEPDPLDGEYPGIEGDKLKKNILQKALNFHADVTGKGFELAGYPVKSSVIFRTGKYDAIYPPSEEFIFPDEGIRFFFDENKLQHVTVRPSGTGNSLRFHIQLHGMPTEANLVRMKKELRDKGHAIMDDLRKKLGAPRG